MLSPGTRLGPYEIVGPLGAGGMGEVFRARDARLSRDVAIKALPPAFALDPERLARFEREARLLASLSHPNIAGIHGLEEVGGTRYLVLEFVDGETLQSRLERGVLPLDEALDVARQVAAGVEAAHEAGVVHRDLKPGNVMLTATGAVKVLDFGLATSGTGRGPDSNPNLSASPTLAYQGTEAGVILGTAAYMSPEQARGKPVDRRTDIWSFGCVMYEMLTRRRAFDGETVSDMVARILEREPDWSALPATTPPRLLALLKRCLTKDAKQRQRDIGDVRLELEAIAAGDRGEAPGAANAATTAKRGTPAWALVLGGLALLALGAVTTLRMVPPAAPSGPVRRFRVPVPGFKISFFHSLALTRDGRSVAYEAGDRLWIRRFDQLEATEVPGSNRGRAPFWSWDQSTVCFSANKRVWAYALGGDRSRELCNIPESGEIVGGAWSADDRIVLAVWRGGLYEYPAGGGEVRLKLAIDSATVDFHGPTFLPDGRTLLVTIHDRGTRSAVAIVEGSPARLKRVFADSSGGAASYSPTGHLLIAREKGVIGTETWAVPFSVRSRAVTGPAFRVLDGAAFAAGTSDGMLIAAEDEPPTMGQLVWRGRTGGVGEAVGDMQPGLSGPVLSPDGGRVAYEAAENGNLDVWVEDLVRGTKSRIASSPDREGDPSWSEDGSKLYFSRGSTVGGLRIMVISSDGSGSPDTITRGQQPAASPDGKSLVYTIDRRGNSDLWTVPIDRQGEAKPFLATSDNESSPCFSPDGRWIAYASDESGRSEAYIRRYPEGDMRTQVSVRGGDWPRWTRRGDEIYFVKGDTLEIVHVGPGPRPVLSLPRPLFSTSAEEFDLRPTRSSGVPVDALPDGARFIGVQRAAAGAPRSLLFVQNWLEEFRKR
jgi:WD40 repeat protein